MTGVGLRVVENEQQVVESAQQVLRTSGVVEDDRRVAESDWRVEAAGVALTQTKRWAMSAQ
jgi:hypothetical protein